MDSARVDGRKVRGDSGVLGREFHLDVFALGHRPRFGMVLVGGSGVDRDEYERRSSTLVDVFDDALSRLAADLELAFAYVTAPFDVAFRDLGNDEALAERWERHFRDELLVFVPEVPLYLVGYSGGAALVLNGCHLHDRCFGAGALGGDAIPTEFRPGPCWAEPLTLYYNRDDRVFAANREAITSLEEGELARCYRRLPGTHRLADYVANESFGGLVRRAARLLAW